MSILDRAKLVLEILADESAGLPFGTLCQRLELPKGSVHPLLATLTCIGYVERSPVDERYRLTMWLPALGFRFLHATGLVDVCQPIVDRCAQLAGELVQLGVVTGDTLVYAAWAQGQKSGLQYVPARGRRVCLHGTGTGTAWLATLPENDVVRVVTQGGFGTSDAVLTRNTVRTFPELFEKLRLTRERGYGINLEETNLGINACAVAFAADNKPGSPVVGTVGMAGPTFRLTKERIAELFPLLQSTAEELKAVWPMRAYLEANEDNQSLWDSQKRAAGRGGVR